MTLQHRRLTSASGFTLIELLVVIAIISILAAILFPVFARARDKARQTACLSNTKQLALAWLQYVQDYDEINPMNGYYYGGTPGHSSCDDFTTNQIDPLGYPKSEYSYPLSALLPSGSDGCNPWFNLLYPYYKTVDVLRCPSRRDGAVTEDAANGEWDDTPWTWCEYGMNMYIDQRSMAKVDQPANTMAFAEAKFGWLDAVSNWPRLAPRHPYGDQSTTSSRYWHKNGGINVGFIDGHVKWNTMTYMGGHPEIMWPGLHHWCGSNTQSDVNTDGTLTIPSATPYGATTDCEWYGWARPY